VAKNDWFTSKLLAKVVEALAREGPHQGVDVAGVP
jgi:hypothetical protein